MLKKAIFLLFFVFSSISVNAFVFKDFNQAFESAKKADKLLIVVGVANDCRYCHIFMHNLQSDKRFEDYASRFDWAFLEITQNPELFVKFFQIQSTPTTYILVPSKMDYYIPEIKGAVNIDELFKYLDAVNEEISAKIKDFKKFNAEYGESKIDFSKF